MYTLTRTLYNYLANKALNFDDRAGPAEFWLFTLACLLIATICSPVLLLVPQGLVIFTLISLVLLFFWTFAAIRRLHDLNQSGLLLSLPPLCYGVFTLLAVYTRAGDINTHRLILFCGYVIMACVVIFIFTLLSLPGSTMANCFGPPLRKVKTPYTDRQAHSEGYPYYKIKMVEPCATKSVAPSPLQSQVTPNSAPSMPSSQAYLPPYPYVATQPYYQNLYPANNGYSPRPYRPYSKPPYSAYKQYHPSQSHPYRPNPYYIPSPEHDYYNHL